MKIRNIKNNNINQCESPLHFIKSFQMEESDTD
jgi:hypothetical protein